MREVGSTVGLEVAPGVDLASNPKRRRIWRCRACGRVRHVDDDGHCDDCAANETSEEMA